MMAWSGLLVLVGVITVGLALEYWIILQFSGPMFWIMQGLWLLGAGIATSVIAALIKSGQAAQNSNTTVNRDSLE